MKNTSNTAIQKRALTKDEEKLKAAYLDEYFDRFPLILAESSKDFLGQLSQRVQISLEDANVNLQDTSYSLVEDMIKDQLYDPYHKMISHLYHQQVKLLAKYEKGSTSERKSITPSDEAPKYFYGPFIKHCKSTKDPVHSCGEKLVQASNSGDKDWQFLFCLKCKRVYRPNFIQLYCESCDLEYYSSVLSDSENPDFLPATWENYHCGAIVNDKMKCVKCKGIFFLNMKTWMLECINCKMATSPQNIQWMCVLCKADFTSDAKPYNPLEFKNIKISVKNAIYDNIKAKPNFVPCCVFEIGKATFYHKKECRGELLEGQLNKKDIIVCSKCKSMNYSDKYIWTCPLCNKMFKTTSDDIRRPRRLQTQMACSSKLTFSDENSKSKYQLLRQGSYVQKANALEPVMKPKMSSNMLGSYATLKNSETKNPGEDEDSIRMPSASVKNSPTKRPAGNLNDILNISISFNVNVNLINKSNEGDISIDKCERKNSRPQVPAKRDVSRFSTSEDTFLSQDLEETEVPKKNSPEKIVRRASSKMVSSSTNEVQISKKEFNLEDFKIIKPIGEGAFGIIYQVANEGAPLGNTNEKEFYAMKKIIANTKTEIDEISHEYELMSSLVGKFSNLNIVTIYGIATKMLDETTYAMYVLMDLATSDWEKEISTRGKSKDYYTEDELLGILSCLVTTMSKLQRANISHRDIKPQNILIFPGNVFKIADFGEAKEVKASRSRQQQTVRGTELYMSPTLFLAFQNTKSKSPTYVEHNTYKSDVFSLGLCLLLAATLTINALYDLRELKDMQSIQVVLSRYLRGRYSAKLVNILCKMLELNEKNRFDFLDLEVILL